METCAKHADFGCLRAHLINQIPYVLIDIYTLYITKRKRVFHNKKQQRRRPACTFAQTVQRIFFFFFFFLLFIKFSLKVLLNDLSRLSISKFTCVVLFYRNLAPVISIIIIGHRRERTRLWRLVNNKCADQFAHTRSLVSAFVIRLLETVISRLASSKISIF